MSPELSLIAWKLAEAANAVEELFFHVDAHAVRVVIKHDWQVCCAINGQGMQRQFPLGWQGIRRRRQQNHICAVFSAVFCQFDGMIRVNGTGTEDDDCSGRLISCDLF